MKNSNRLVRTRRKARREYFANCQNEYATRIIENKIRKAMLKPKYKSKIFQES